MSKTAHSPELPVAVIGAGPVGLAAAAHLLERGIAVKIYEAGETVGAHVRGWGHVRLFSPWRYNVDEVSTALLRKHGWQEPPADALPTGGDLYAAYLEPLAQTEELAAVIETKARVRSIGRQGIDKVASRGRAAHPFMLAIERAAGDDRIELARAVIDASGTWGMPNPLMASGMRSAEEDRLAGRIAYGIPDVLGSDRGAYAGKRVLVVGGGHSAANVLLDLARLAAGDSDTRLTWAVRGTNLARVFGGGAADQLPARGQLGTDLKRLVDSARLDLVLGFAAQAVHGDKSTLTVTGRVADQLRVLGPFDRVVVATGQRPDLAMTRELRLDLDPWLEGARALGPMIDPNLHSCGSVQPHGYRELSHPDPDYFAVGIKSYGRAPTFLLATGYEQVRSVVAHLAGDEAAATDVRLALPETGICSTNLIAAETEANACCAGPRPSASCCAGEAKPTAQTAGCCGRGEPEAAREAVDAGCCAR